MPSRLVLPVPLSSVEQAAQAALLAGDLVAFQATLASPSLNDNARGRMFSRLLAAVATAGHTDLAQAMLATGVCQTKGITGARPMDLAIRNNQLAMVQLLWDQVGAGPAVYGSHWAVESMDDGVARDVRAFVLSRVSDNELCFTTPINAAMRDTAAGWHDWANEVNRRHLTVAQSELDFALDQAAQHGKVRSVQFLLEGMQPPASPLAERGIALQSAASFGHDPCVRLLLAHLQATDVLDICKTMMRRKKGVDGSHLTAQDNLEHINRIARLSDASQQAALVAHFRRRLIITLPRERFEQAQTQRPRCQRARARS